MVQRGKLHNRRVMRAAVKLFNQGSDWNCSSANNQQTSLQFILRCFVWDTVGRKITAQPFQQK